MSRLFERECIDGDAEVTLTAAGSKDAQSFLLLEVRSEDSTELGVSNMYLGSAGAKALAHALNTWVSKQERTAREAENHHEVLTCANQKCRECEEVFR